MCLQNHKCSNLMFLSVQLQNVLLWWQRVYAQVVLRLKNNLCWFIIPVLVVMNRTANGSMSCPKYLHFVATNTVRNCLQVSCGGSLTNAETQTWTAVTGLAVCPSFGMKKKYKKRKRRVAVSQFRVCILRGSIRRPIMSQRRAKPVPIRRLLQMQPTNAPSFPCFLEDAPLLSFVPSHIPRFPKKKKEREKMATSRGVDCHFRGPGWQK